MVLTRRAVAVAAAEGGGGPDKLAAKADENEVPDWYGWREHQRQWFWRTMKKNAVVFVLYVVMLVCTIGWLPHTFDVDPPTVSHTFVGQVSPLTRIAGTALCTFIAVLTVYIDIVRSTPPGRGDNKWILMDNGIGGDFAYLTFNILIGHVLYWPCCLFAEVAWYMLHHEDAKGLMPSIIAQVGQPDEAVWATPYVRNLLLLCYSLSVFSATLGTVLCFLFLKFNWYEPDWRRDVLEVYYARGQHSFGTKALFNHLNQLPLAMIDIMVLKDDAMLRRVLISPQTLILMSVLYMAIFICYTHLNYRVNGGLYVYPIFEKVLSSWKIEMAFLSAVSLFVFGVAMVFYLLAHYF